MPKNCLASDHGEDRILSGLNADEFRGFRRQYFRLNIKRTGKMETADRSDA